MRSLRALIAAVAALGAVTLHATPAVAANAAVDDLRGDVHSQAATPSAKQRAQVDLVRGAYWTTADHVWIRWSVADLRSDVVRPDFLFVEPDDAGYPIYTVSVWSYEDHPYVQITGADDSVSLRCRTNGSVKVDYARNFVQAVFSKGCFVRGHRINTPHFMSIFRSRDNQVQLNDVTRAVPGFVPNP